MRQLRLIGALVRLKIARQTAFRLGFFGPLFVDGSLFILQILMFSAIFAHVDSIAGWGRGQTLLFIGTFSLINAINMTVFFFGIQGLPNLVRNGDFDGYLTRPVNPLLRLTFENVNLGSAPLILFSIGIIVYAVRVIGLTPTFLQVGGYGLLVFAMLVLWYDLMVLLRSVVFFVISASSIGRLEGAFLEMCMMLPGTAYKGVFRLIFQVLLPYGIIGTVPVQFFSGILAPGELAGALATVGVFTVLAWGTFRVGCRNYKSASS